MFNLLISSNYVLTEITFIVFFLHLHQLDAGVPEKISLVSRDEKSVLVVTYSDLKRCFDSTFQELQAAASGSL